MKEAGTILHRVYFLPFIVLALSSYVSSQTWTNEAFEVTLKNTQIQVAADGKSLVDITAVLFNFENPQSLQVLENGPNGMVIEAVYPATVHHGIENAPGVARIEITNVKNGIRLYSEPQWAFQVTLQLRDQDEHYFGLVEKLIPNNERTTDLRGAVLPIDVESYSDFYYENNASAYSTFYISSRGYGAFFDTFARGQYQMAVNGITQLHHDNGKLDWYIFYGPSGKKIHEGYFSVIGKPKYVPLWACGPIVWRDQHRDGKEEILQDLQRFAELKIPLTACWVDRPYSNGDDEWSLMDFSDRFANADTWIKEINDKYGMQLMTWLAPMTFGDRDFPGLLINWKGYIDLTNAEALQEFERRLKTHQYSVNVRGHKMDRGDEELPLTHGWKDRTKIFARRNKYVYLYAKVVDQFLQNAFGKDQFNFARAGIHRCQPYLSALWGGDSRSTWDGLRCQVINALRCSYMGFPMWGSDVGGYLNSIDEGHIPEELYARWLQFGTWSGLFEIKIDNVSGWGKDRPPWKYGESLQRVFRSSCETRMQLLPYIYSALNTAYENGIVMKPLSYVFPDDPKTLAICDEYMFGDAFLLAPILDSTNQRQVYLPAGTWYDFNDVTKTYHGSQSIILDVPMEQTPVFVSANSIFVTGNVLPGNAKIWEPNAEREIVIHAFPGKVGESAQYDYVDPFDGDSEKEISLNRGEDHITLRVDPIGSRGSIAVKTDKRPSKVSLNNRNISFKWNEKQGLSEIAFRANERVTLQIKAN